MTLGDSCFGVGLTTLGALRIADIKRRAVDPINLVGGERPLGESARLKASAKTNIEARVMWAVEASVQSRRRTTRFVTGCLADPAPRVEVLLSTPAARLNRCPPHDPNTARTCAAPRSKTGVRLTSPTSSPRHIGRARAPDTAARWRRPSGPQDASTRPHPLRPRRAYAVTRCAHISTLRHPVLTRLTHATRGHQTLLHRSTPANRHQDPRTHPRNLRARSCPRRPGHRSRTRKCPSRAPRRIDRHASAARARHALRAQRALQHRRLGYNILWLGPSIIVQLG